jgi:hypothetical protein
MDELAPQDLWDLMLPEIEIAIAERPDDPAQVARVMHRLERMLLDVANLLKDVNLDRYEAELAFSRARNEGVAEFAERHQVTVAKALADVRAEPFKRAWDAQCALFRHVSDVQRALQSKHFGLMNLNRNLASAMFEAGRR